MSVDRLEARTEIARPAQDIARLNRRLACTRTIPSDVVDAVRQISTGVTGTALARWNGSIPISR